MTHGIVSLTVLLCPCKALIRQQTSILGGQDPTTLNLRGSLAGVLLSLGQEKAALAAYECVLQDQESSLGSDHLNTITTRHCLAMLLDKLHSSSLAYAEHEKCQAALVSLEAHEEEVKVLFRVCSSVR